jgi:coenzyme F420 hydrogenase subunit beta
MSLTNRGLYEPTIDSDLCTYCANCLKVCGRYKLDYAKLRKVVFNKGTFHPLLGQLISCYRGHASDYDLRWKATSGGTITALLKLAFEIGMIDAVVVTGPDPSDPVMTQPFVAHSFEQVLQACGARYAPSPVNRCLREAMQNDRIAIVGLPCHFESLRKAEAVRKELEQKVILRLGLFCSHNVSLLATEFVYRHFRVPRAKIASFKYRGDGWPGGIRIKTVDDQEFWVPNQGSFWTQMFMAFIFATPYCFLCTDHTSEFADISFGDAWLPEVMETDDVGESVIITRTPMGERLIREAVKQGKLQVSELSADKVVESQLWPLYFKKWLIYSKRAMLAEKRFDVGKGDEPLPSLTRTEHWLARRAWFNAVNSCHPFMPALLSCLPLRLVQAYSRHYRHELWKKASIWLQEMKD